MNGKSRRKKIQSGMLSSNRFLVINRDLLVNEMLSHLAGRNNKYANPIATYIRLV